ncbi:hypothetical protein CLORY_30240 [Clostridium oryzae]|uniref:4Fe4S-binding SPASM domain-containing protein n=1 Tax=Clostridium oryzae TaxID=1450648 RepID=A0A1V4IJN7_9CLOT|nr:hypothetical protein CLORY_30240 [Clostridium oryzae]
MSVINKLYEKGILYGVSVTVTREFFYVNVDGAAEPCPFSPYSDTNLNDTSLIQALKSPLFKELNETGMLVGEHEGGCLLFEKSSEVRKIVNTPKMFPNNSEL